MMRQHPTIREALPVKNGKRLACPIVSIPILDDHLIGRGINTPICNPATFKLLLIKVKEALSNELSSYIVDCSSEFLTAHFFLDLLEGCFDTFAISAVGADTDGLAACSIDLLDNRVVIG